MVYLRTKEKSFNYTHFHSSSFCEGPHFWQVVLGKSAPAAANLLQDLSISLKWVELLHCFLQKKGKHMQLKARCTSMVEVQSQIPAILAGCNCTTIPCFASPAAKICTCFSYFVASLLHDFCRQVNRRGKATRNHGFQNRHHENQQTSLTKDSFTCCASKWRGKPGTTLTRA